MWALDALRDAAVIDVAAVELPPLPADASPAARLLRSRLAVLLGLRALRDDGEAEFPFTKRFAAEWCGIAETTAQRAKGELLRAGVLVKVGEHASRHGRSPATIYRRGHA